MESFLSIKQVREIVSLSTAEIDRRVKAKTFPKKVKVGYRRMFVCSEIQDWIFEQIAKRDSAD